MPETKRITSVARLPKRSADAHKGDFGRLLVVGGSEGMIGAPALAANASLRGGAGLVTMALPRSIQLTCGQLCMCAMSIPLECDDAGTLCSKAIRQVSKAAADSDVIAAGPGFAVGTQQENVVRVLLGQARPVVLDADGLNNLARICDWSRIRTCPLVLTPHPGEFARLTGMSIADIQADREQVVLAAMQKWTHATDAELVCVLKGESTVVVADGVVYVNDTGNPGMATGGSGDVLTGLIAAFIAQGLSAFDAATLGVRVHGRAGDMAAAELGQVSLIASDLLDYLPGAIVEACE